MLGARAPQADRDHAPEAEALRSPAEIIESILARDAETVGKRFRRHDNVSR
ncbi:hypothetical protein [Gemmobacter aquaticus]|uniref:hypothetical protein n=1 Tax=Gemmobacter aquaticus TaxID=490185 RepID=UPI0013152CE3|nr:hypothetical protein [Gemmobacter aquaticus]